jgi:hypothetical protein
LSLAVTPRVVPPDWMLRWFPPPRALGAGVDERVAQPDRVSRRVLDVLLSGRFRKGSREAMQADEFAARHIDLIAGQIGRAQPVQITLIGFPFKAPNPLKVGPRTLPDLAEVAALATLAQLNCAVQAAYPPGLEIVVIHDGTYIASAFDVSLSEARAYAEYFGSLLRATGTHAFVRQADLAELMAAHGPGDAAPTSGIATDGATPVGAPANPRPAALRKTLGLLNVRSLPAGTLSAAVRATLSGDHDALPGDAALLPMRAWRAMEDYEACDALLRRFDPRPRAFPAAIHATTRSQPGRLALWLVRRGRSLLPWQGVGVIRGDRVEVRHAVDVETSPDFRPVFVQGEDTPFCYEPVAPG